MLKDRIGKRGLWGLSVVVAALAMFATGFLTSPAQAQSATVSREQGADRYATAAQISHDTFSPGVPVAIIATGDNFPDALAGAAAAGKLGAPILLVQQNSIPASTASELTRLNPGRILILGGLSAVSGGVETTLDQYTAGTVTRDGGVDRYDTAATISHDAFNANVPVAYVATGQNYPDALTAGPAAFKEGPGPVLLVMQNSIPSSTATELTRLHAQKVVIIGGTSAVSDNVKNDLDPYSTDPVVRRSGADRYATAVAVSNPLFPAFADGSGTVYLATGANYPDALAGGAAAAKKGSPVLLVQQNCVPQNVKDEITRLNPKDVIILGGTSAVGTAVESLTVCTAGQTTSGTDFGFPTTGGTTFGSDFGIPTTGGTTFGSTFGSDFGSPTGG